MLQRSLFTEYKMFTTLNQFSPRAALSPIDDVLIVGGGTAGLSTFVHLVKNAIKEGKSNFTIRIVEKNATVGSGLPWNPAQPLTLRVNDPNNEMIIIQNSKEEKEDFVNWLHANAARLKDRYPHKLIEELIIGKDRFAPRCIFGEYCEDKLKEYKQKAELHGIKVRIDVNTEMVDAKQDSQDTWRLKSNKGGYYRAQNLVLTVGHMPSDKYIHLNSLPQFYSSPWTVMSAKNISDIPGDQAVVILGSGLTAIDAVKLLIAQGHRGTIYFCSPSGHLPRLKGPATSLGYKLKFFNLANLNIPDLTLDKVKELFTLEFNHATGLTKTWEEIIKLAQTYGDDPEQTLEDEIKIVEEGRVRSWQLLLSEMFFGALPAIGFNLSEADLTKFIKDYFGICDKWMAGMPLSNAKEILGILKSGQLKIIKGHPDLAFDPEKKQYQVKIEDCILTAASVINCTGTSSDIRQNPLLNSMLKQGLLQGFSDWGGVVINPDFQINAKNCWVFGPCAFPRNLTAYSVEQGSINGAKVAGILTHKLAQEVCKDSLPISKFMT